MPVLRAIAPRRFSSCHYPIADPAAEPQKLAPIG